MTPRQQLLSVIDAYRSGADRSVDAIGKLEAILIQHYVDSEIFEYLAEPVSLYRPFCGDPYVGEEEMNEILNQARRMLLEND